MNICQFRNCRGIGACVTEEEVFGEFGAHIPVENAVLFGPEVVFEFLCVVGGFDGG